MATCVSSGIAHTSAFVWALSQIDPILEATTAGQKRSAWGGLVAAEIGMVAAAYIGFPSCSAASLDVTCSPGSQAIAAVALALMVMEWSMVIPVDIALFICSLTIC